MLTYFERCRIPLAASAERLAIADLVQQCLLAQERDAELAELEDEIDLRVARCYGPDADE